jgi:spore coat polysaccharide biosynthesis protein SpsF
MGQLVEAGGMSTPRVVIVCQARTGSSRLPRKVLLPLAGAPLLIRFVERIQQSRLATQIVVATTTEASDDPLVLLCEERDIKVMRGHPTDLLDRHLAAALECKADVVVKIPSDCPLIDPEVIDRVIGEYLAHRDTVDYVSNLHPPTYPDGNDVEVMSVQVLQRAWDQGRLPHEREHTTPWLWDANPDIRTRNVVWETGQDFSMSHRWTIDYAEDYMFIKAIYDALYKTRPHFTIADILEYIAAHPEVAATNSHLAGVNWYRNHLDDLRTVTPEQTRTYPPLAL